MTQTQPYVLRLQTHQEFLLIDEPETAPVCPHWDTHLLPWHLLCYSGTSLRHLAHHSSSNTPTPHAMMQQRRHTEWVGTVAMFGTAGDLRQHTDHSWEPWVPNKIPAAVNATALRMTGVLSVLLRTLFKMCLPDCFRWNNRNHEVRPTSE